MQENASLDRTTEWDTREVLGSEVIDGVHYKPKSLYDNFGKQYDMSNADKATAELPYVDKYGVARPYADWLSHVHKSGGTSIPPLYKPEPKTPELTPYNSYESESSEYNTDCDSDGLYPEDYDYIKETLVESFACIFKHHMVTIRDEIMSAVCMIKADLRTGKYSPIEVISNLKMILTLLDVKERRVLNRIKEF